ncbi:MAG TPA: hypothetical protein VNC78_09380 [Actinomycetota bacterium]|nr:hypothetical protein [Actinomycetota bacterium]
MSKATDSVSYAASLTPRIIYRVVFDDDGPMGYQATPESPRWALAQDAVDLVARGAADGIFGLSTVEAMFLIHLWGGGRDALDDPNSPTPPPVADAEPEEVPALGRVDVFRTLRDMGRVMTHHPGDIRVIKPEADSPTLVGRDGGADRTDLRQDEKPLARPLFDR